MNSGNGNYVDPRIFVTSMIITSFSTVAALAWNTTIRDMIDQYIDQGTSIRANLVYALSVTLISIIAIYFIYTVQSSGSLSLFF